MIFLKKKPLTAQELQKIEVFYKELAEYIGTTRAELARIYIGKRRTLWLIKNAGFEGALDSAQPKRFWNIGKDVIPLDSKIINPFIRRKKDKGGKKPSFKKRFIPRLR